MSISFNRVYYDAYKRKIHLWETVDGKRYSDVIDVTYEYYIYDEKNQSEIKDIFGKSVIKKQTKDLQSIRTMKESGQLLCESDIPQDVKFLHKRYEGKDLKPDIKDFNVGYLDIEVEVEDEFPHANLAKYPINLITLILSKTGKSYTFALKRPYTGEKQINYKYFETEKEMLESFIVFFNKAKVDILTGWNISGQNGFDIPYIINRCRILDVSGSLSPVGKYYQNQKTLEWSVPGISIMDYMQFYLDPKFYQTKLESYSLDYVCNLELGKGKLQYEGSINELYKNDWNKFVDYNIEDSILVKELDDLKKFIELAINLCHNSMIPLDRVFSAVAVIEGQILTYLHEKNMVMPDKKEGICGEELPGAYVESQMGYYEDVISYDFESLYPNMMIHYNISPETLVMHPIDTTGLIKTPLSDEFGIYYKSQKGLLTEIVEKNFKERKQFKELKLKYGKEGNKELESYYDSQQSIRKVFLNSIYGVLSNEWFHFYNINTAKTVTLSGQHLIKFVRDKINQYFNEYFYKNPSFFKEIDENNRGDKNRIVNLDTDSLFIAFQDIKKKISPDKDLLTWANEFNETFLTPLFNKLLDKYFEKFGVQNRIKFKIEKVCTQMIMLGDKGKIYANKIISDEGKVFPKPVLKVSGFAVRRSTTPSYCRNKLKVMLEEFFLNPVKEHMILKIREARQEFLNTPIEEISTNKKINDYNKYATRDVNYYVEHGIVLEPRTPIHNRAGMVYNTFITKYKLPLQPIKSDSKIRYIYVKPDNEFRTDVIGYIGKCPEQIKNKFKIDYDRQFQLGFIQPMQTIFDALGWGTIEFDVVDINNFFEFY